jgi:transcriptional regulator with GAF, ATPase, and Fis domain
MQVSGGLARCVDFVYIVADTSTLTTAVRPMVRQGAPARKPRVAMSAKPSRIRAAPPPLAAPAGWTLLEQLGSGGGGTVWLAKGRGESGPCVLKVAAPGQDATLRREWEALVDVPAPLLPRPIAWLAPDAAAGAPAALAMARRPGAPLDVALRGASAVAVAAAVRAVVRGLGSLHAAGLVHGDLHPGNVLVHLDDGTVRDVALLDLGLATAVGVPVTAPGRLDCAPPERLRGGLADPRDDLFSLAAAVWLAWGLPPPYPGYPLTIPAPGARPSPPAVEPAPGAAPLLAVLSEWLAPARDHRPAHAEAALRRWSAAARLDADEAESLATDLDALAQRPWRWGRWPGQALLPMPQAGSPRAIVGVPGSGRTALLQGLAALAEKRGAAVRWLRPGDVTALAPAREATAGHAALSDTHGAAVARSAAGVVRLAQEVGKNGLLLVDALDQFAPVERAAVVAALDSAAAATALAVAASEPVAGAAPWPMPKPAPEEIDAFLRAAAGGRTWDRAVIADIAAVAGPVRAQVPRLAGRLLRGAAVRCTPDRIEADGSADARVRLLSAESVLPAKRWWPALAHVAVAETTEPGADDDPLPHAALQLAQVTGLVRLDAQGRLVAAHGAARAFLHAHLPPALIAEAARSRCDRCREPVRRVELQVLAARLGAMPWPREAVLAGTVRALADGGEAERAVALACACRARPGGRGEGEAVLVAAHVRALVALGRFSEAEEAVAALDDTVRAAPPVLAARAELGFKVGDYPACRRAGEALVLIGDPAPATAGWLWQAFASTWQGDRAAARQAVQQGRALATEADAIATFAYLAGLGAYYDGRLDDAESAFADLADTVHGTLKAAVVGAVGLVQHRRGNLAAARARYDESRSLAEAAGDRARAANMAMNAAVVDHEAGDLGRALQGYDRVVTLAERARNDGARARALSNRGNLLANLGCHERATEDLRAALQALDQSGSGYLAANVRCVLAEIERRGNHLQGATEHLDRAETALADAGAESERCEIALERGHLALQLGNVEAATSTAIAQRETAARLASPELQARALWLLALTHLDGDAGANLPTSEAVTAAGDALAAGLALAPASKPLLSVGLAADRVRTFLLSGQAAAARDLAINHLARRDRVAATLDPAERTAFLRAPAWSTARILLRLAAAIPAQVTGGAAIHGSALHALVGINRRLSEMHDLPRLLEVLMDSAILLTGAERGFLLLDETEGDEEPARGKRKPDLKVAVARNLDRKNLKKPGHKLSHTIALQVLESGERVLSLDAMADERYSEKASINTGALRSILCVPMTSQGRVIGVLYVDNRFASGAFGSDQAAMLEALADQAAIAIQTARLIARQRQTAAELEQKRVEVEKLNARLEERLHETETALENARADLSAQRLEAARRSDYSALKGEGPKLQRLFALMDRVRDHDFPVLLRGESGTGKELVARAIHFTGRRKRGPFVAVNCGALPSNLLESELFGHVRGSFSGAVGDRRGLFETASGGSLLLDEVGEMPLEMQVKLLRVLQSGEIQRVGDSTTRRVDVRVVAATHRDLAAMVAQGQFREDLFYRLRVVELAMPPLRDRLEDLPLLCDHFLHENRKSGVGRIERVGRDALQLLRAYRWPGNVRQLETLLKSACLFADGTVLQAADVGPLLERERAVESTTIGATMPGQEWLAQATLDVIVARIIKDRIAAHGGNKRRAAQTLGVDRGTLYARLKSADSP